MSHIHCTPFTLALDFDAEDERLHLALARRARECEVCRSAVEELSAWLVALDHPDPLVGPEFATRHDLFKRLLADHRTHEKRLRAVDSDELFHQWGLCRLLLDESSGCRESNRELSAQLAELALAVADRLATDYYGAELVADLRASAAAALGDALRLLEDAQTEDKFETARVLLSQGTGNVRVASEIARLEARFLRDLGRHDEAHELLEKTLAAHHALAEKPRSLLGFVLQSARRRHEG